MAVVSFDIAAFRARYPEFASVIDARLSVMFNEACVYLDNTDTSIVADVGIRGTLLNMLTAHVAKLADSPMVGRIDSATEGSVSATASYSSAISGSMAWYLQTTYGAAYWAATSRYRAFRYRAPGG